MIQIEMKVLTKINLLMFSSFRFNLIIVNYYTSARLSNLILGIIVSY